MQLLHLCHHSTPPPFPPTELYSWAILIHLTSSQQPPVIRFVLMSSSTIVYGKCFRPIRFYNQNSASASCFPRACYIVYPSHLNLLESTEVAKIEQVAWKVNHIGDDRRDKTTTGSKNTRPLHVSGLLVLQCSLLCVTNCKLAFCLLYDIYICNQLVTCSLVLV
jgi:hypothetical protein